MIPAEKSIRAMLGDGTIEAEAADRLKGKLAGMGSPDTWTPLTDARVRMAVTRTLSDIHDELVVRLGIAWEESVALDALRGEYWLNVVIEYIFNRGGGDS